MRKALVVGIDDYPSAPLSGCVNDANTIAVLLEDHANGSPNFAVRLMTSPNESITKISLRQQIDELFSGDAEIALFYFSGHGFINSIGGYIVTTDYESYDEGIPMDEILTRANQSKIREKVIFLDCCHSGRFGSPALFEKAAVLGDGLTILTASRANEAAIESCGRGVFTSLVADALQGGASDLLGEVTPGSIYAYVDRALGPWEQRPIFKTNISRFTSLRSVVPPISREKLRRLTEVFPTPEEEFKLDPSYEFTADCAEDQKCQTFKLLQAYRSVNLVIPVGEEHMYYAAINSKSCRLTAMGLQYWRLVKEKKI